MLERQPANVPETFVVREELSSRGLHFPPCLGSRLDSPRILTGFHQCKGNQSEVEDLEAMRYKEAVSPVHHVEGYPPPEDSHTRLLYNLNFLNKAPIFMFFVVFKQLVLLP